MIEILSPPELARAREELERAVAIVPDSAEIQFQLSRVLERLGDHEGARSARERSEALKAPGGREP